VGRGRRARPVQGAVPAAAIAIVSAVIDMRRHGRVLRGLAIIVIAVAAAVLPARAWLASRRAPPIHDVTTDLDNPPRYVAVAKLRVPPRTRSTTPATPSRASSARPTRICGPWS
jgi:hypothetical protein